MPRTDIKSALAPLKAREFRLQFSAQAISMLGSSLAPVATALGVLAATGSAAALALVTAAYSVALLVAMMAGGVWADRLPRNLILRASNLVQFGAQALFGIVLILHWNNIAVFVVLQVFNGLAQAFGRPAILGITSETAPPGSVQQANALIAGTRDATGILGPLVAGLLTLSVGAGWALIFDSVTYLISAAILSRLNLRTPIDRQTGFMRDLKEGLREVGSRSWLWSSMAYFALFNLAFAIFQVLGPVELSKAPSGVLNWALILAGMSAGGLLGNLAALYLRPRRLLLSGRVLDLLSAPLFILLALHFDWYLLVPAAVLFGIAMTYGDALWYTALIQEVPDDKLSRVSSLDLLGSMALRPVGYALAALLASAGTTSILLILGAVVAGATALTLLMPSVRRLSRRDTERDLTESSEMATH